MKISTLPTPLMLVLALTARSTLGASCTADEASETADLFANVTASDACAALASNAAATSLDYCQDGTCLALLQDLAAQVPDCEGEGGVNKRQGLEDLLVFCDDVTATIEASASASGSVGGSGEASASSAAGAPASGGSNGAIRRALTALALAAPVAATVLLS